MKRIIAAILIIATVLLTVNLNGFALNPDSGIPAQNGVTSSSYFRALPTVLEMGDGYAVVWATSFNGTGYIEYTYNGTKYTVYDEKNGLVRTHDNIHVVKVPHEHLANNSYTVYSKAVTAHNSTSASFGATVSCGPITLKGYDGGEDVNLLVLTDIHSDLTKAKQAVKYFNEDPDIIAFTGDITSYIQTKDQIITDVFAIMGTITQGKYPTVYCRGNHETRGRYASMLMEYFPTSTGEFYYDFNYGPLSALVLDTGEDKDDEHVEYGGLTNYEGFIKREEAWLKTLSMSKTAKYRIGIYHIPTVAKLPNGMELASELRPLGIQLGITGHHHINRMLNIGDTLSSSVMENPTLVSGGPVSGEYCATFVKFTGGTAKIKTVSNSGSVKLDTTMSLPNAPITEGLNTPPTSGNTAATNFDNISVVNGQVKNKVTSSYAALSFKSEPAVFESGSDYYNVVWATNIDATGFVEYTYAGKTYQLYDEAAGYRRSYDSIHTVKVPKEHLNNNNYKVVSFHMEVHDGYSFTRGNKVTSKTYSFENRESSATASIFVTPDVKENGNGVMAENMRKAVQALGTNPALVVLNGDAVYTMLDKTDFADMLKAAAYVSYSSHPVVFARGNLECRGAFASQIMRYIPTVTGEFFFDFDYGNTKFAVIDTAEDKADNHAEYAGLVHFDELRARENEWLSGIDASDGKTLVAIAHIQNLNANHSYDWEKQLKDKGTDIMLLGNTMASSTTVTDGIVRVQCGGRKSDTQSIASHIFVSDNYVRITACDTNGALVYEKTVNMANGTEQTAVTATEPTKTGGSYVITEPAHLVWLSNQVNSGQSFSGQSFILGADIDMKLVPFTPIGGNTTAGADNDTTTKAFSGSFDGNGYVIKNLYIKSTLDDAGLFGATRNASLKNIYLASGSIMGKTYLGGVVGYAYATTVSCCFNFADVHSEGTQKIGGIAGFICYGTTVDQCANYGTVSGNKTSNQGGVVGQSFNATNKISNSYNLGNVATLSPTNTAIGGILGYCGVSACQVANCYNAGAMLAPAACGTVVGTYNSAGTLSFENCYFEGTKQTFMCATANGTDGWSTQAGSGTIVNKSTAELKTVAMASLLNAETFAIHPTANACYPILKALLEYYGFEKYIKGVEIGTDVNMLKPRLEGTSTKIFNRDGEQITGKTKLATGFTVSFYDSQNAVIETKELVVTGDANGDSVITATDYLTCAALLTETASLPEAYKYAADMNANGTLESGDYLQYINLLTHS